MNSPVMMHVIIRGVSFTHFIPDWLSLTHKLWQIITSFILVTIYYTSDVNTTNWEHVIKDKSVCKMCVIYRGENLQFYDECLKGVCDKFFSKPGPTFISISRA